MNGEHSGYFWYLDSGATIFRALILCHQSLVASLTELQYIAGRAYLQQCVLELLMIFGHLCIADLKAPSRQKNDSL